jgi:hypothetical protein
MVAVPAATPVTTPVVPSMVATAVLVLVHIPPEVAFASVVFCPEHTVKVPVTGGNTGGNGVASSRAAQNNNIRSSTFFIAE